MDTVLLFSRGKTEDKLRIIFDMCDKDSNGVIDKEELSEMLRSLVEIARTTSLSDDHVTELIDGMFQVSRSSPVLRAFPIFPSLRDGLTRKISFALRFTQQIPL